MTKYKKGEKYLWISENLLLTPIVVRFLTSHDRVPIDHVGIYEEDVSEEQWNYYKDFIHSEDEEGKDYIGFEFKGDKLIPYDELTELIYGN